MGYLKTLQRLLSLKKTIGPVERLILAFGNSGGLKNKKKWRSYQMLTIGTAISTSIGILRAISQTG